jgi:hypothetical protein
MGGFRTNRTIFSFAEGVWDGSWFGPRVFHPDGLPADQIIEPGPFMDDLPAFLALKGPRVLLRAQFFPRPIR